MNTVNATCPLRLFQSPNSSDTYETMELAPCPFCGSPAQLKATRMFADPAYKAQCSQCHITTTPIIVGEYASYHGEETKTFTDDEARQETIRIWNTRTEIPTTPL